MGLYTDKILPRLMDRVTGAAMFDKPRTMACAPLYGQIIEIGFGSGTNVPFLPDAVTKVFAIDPAVIGQELARPRISARGIPVEFVGLDGARIGLPDDSVDCVLSTLTLCTIPDVESALNEVVRVLKPGGVFSYFEHGLSPKESTRRLQKRFNGLQKRCFGGCQLVRDIHEMVASSQLEIVNCTSFVKRRAMAMFHWHAGVARKQTQEV